MSHELYVLSVCVTCCGQQFPCQLQGTGAECVPRVVCPKCLCDLLWAAVSLSATGHGGRVCPTSCMCY